MVAINIEGMGMILIVSLFIFVSSAISFYGLIYFKRKLKLSLTDMNEKFSKEAGRSWWWKRPDLFLEVDKLKYYYLLLLLYPTSGAIFLLSLVDALTPVKIFFLH